MKHGEEPDRRRSFGGVVVEQRSVEIEEDRQGGDLSQSEFVQGIMPEIAGVFAGTTASRDRGPLAAGVRTPSRPRILLFPAPCPGRNDRNWPESVGVSKTVEPSMTVWSTTKPHKTPAGIVTIARQPARQSLPTIGPYRNTNS